MKLTPLVESTQGPALTNHRTASKAPDGFPTRLRIRSIYPAERPRSRVRRFDLGHRASFDLARDQQFFLRLPTNQLCQSLSVRCRIVGRARKSRWRLPMLATGGCRV